MSTESTNAEILLVEDNVTTSRTLLLFLNSQGYKTDCAFDGREAISKFGQRKFDLVILDLMLPDIDGLVVCKQIRAGSSTPIVILSAKSTEDEIVEGLETGADDYVCKPFGAKELLARVRRCLTRSVDDDAAGGQWQVGDLCVNHKTRAVCLRGDNVKLTKSEFEILLLLIRNPGRVFTRDQLIHRVFGPGFEGGDRTIDTHIWSLRKKLGEPRGNPGYIISEQGVGYRMKEDHAN
jgi:DNA-binding response OmpR family regulator